MAGETNKIENTSAGRGAVLADVICERGILGLILAILVIGPLALGAVKPIEFAIIEGLTALVLLLWCVRVWLNPRYRFFWPPICWGVLAVAIYGIVRSCLAEMPHAAREEMWQTIVYATLFFTIVNNLNRRESATIVTITLIVLAVGLCCFAFYQVTTKSPNIWLYAKPEIYRGRASGTFINPNHFAGFLEMVLPLCLAYVIVGRVSHTAKVLLGYSALIICIGIGLTLSRGGVIAIAVSVLLLLGVLLLQRKYTLVAAGVVATLLIFGSIYSYYFPQTRIRFENARYLGGVKVNDRYIYWQAGIALYKENPVWGIGSGHFDQKFWPHRPVSGGRLRYVHNDYIQTLCEWGAVGFGLIVVAIGMLGVGVRTVWRALSSSELNLVRKSSTRLAFVLGASFSLIAILVHSFFDFNMHIPANATLFVVLMALLASHLRFATERYWGNPGFLWRFVLTITGVTCMGFMGTHALKSSKAGYYLERAADVKAQYQEKIAFLERAALAEPDNYRTALYLGEAYRVESWKGKDGYRDSGEKALAWYKKAMELNRYDPACPLGYGMCLDLLGRENEATPFFEKAAGLDPRGFQTINYLGWHYIQLGNYAAAKTAFERSRRIWYTPMAAYYIDYLNNKLREAALKQK